MVCVAVGVTVIAAALFTATLPSAVQPVGTADSVPFQPPMSTLLSVTLSTVYFTSPAVASTETAPLAVAAYLILPASS